MAELHLLFPTPVYETVLQFRPLEVKSMIDFMDSVPWAQDYDIFERPNGETTQLDKDLLACPELKVLENKIFKEMDKYVKILQIDRKKHGLKRINSWGNINREGNYTHKHHHTNTMFAGVFSLKTPEKGGDIIFSSMAPTWTTNYWSFSMVTYDDLNTFQRSFTPQECGLILFPGHLKHYVVPSKSKENRYSIAFNYNLDGEFGVGTNYLKMEIQNGYTN